MYAQQTMADKDEKMRVNLFHYLTGTEGEKISAALLLGGEAGR